MSTPNVDAQYEDEDWLGDDFKPLTFRRMMWQRLSGAPLVGVGLVATAVSLAMASYQMKLGNSKRFNYWLRWRVASQFATIGAAIYYGGAAFTRAKQDQITIRQQVLLGDLPKNTPIPPASNNPFGTPLPRPVPSDFIPAPEPEGPMEPDPNYPLPVKDRMRVSDFAYRLRQAEEQQRLEDEARARGDFGSASGAQPVTGSGQLLKRRMEREKEKLEAKEAPKEKEENTE